VRDYRGVDRDLRREAGRSILAKGERDAGRWGKVRHPFEFEAGLGPAATALQAKRKLDHAVQIFR
jgi:hypothetical protein